MQVCPTDPRVSHMAFGWMDGWMDGWMGWDGSMYDFKFYTLNYTTLKILGFKCLKKLQGIFIHRTLPDTVIYFNIIVSALMKAL